jgi:hypothetical protein
VLAGPGIAATCAAVLPWSFPAFRANFALATMPAATAVPVSATKSAIVASTIAGLGRWNLFRMLPPFVFDESRVAPGSDMEQNVKG